MIWVVRSDRGYFLLGCVEGTLRDTTHQVAAFCDEAIAVQFNAGDETCKPLHFASDKHALWKSIYQHSSISQRGARGKPTGRAKKQARVISPTACAALSRPSRNPANLTSEPSQNSAEPCGNLRKPSLGNLTSEPPRTTPRPPKPPKPYTKTPNQIGTSGNCSNLTPRNLRNFA